MAARPHTTLLPSRSKRAGADASPIAVLIADDHAVMRRALRLLLDHEADVEVIAEVDDVAKVAEHARVARPHVLVLDLNMPGDSSIRAVERLRRQTTDIQIVLLTMEQSPAFARQALAAGAVGVVTKHHSHGELATAVRAAVHGERYLSPSIAGQLDMARPAYAGDPLSQREIEVLRLIALGYTSVEIARKLRLSPRTIESHRAHITSKLGLTTRAELVRYALSRGLLTTNVAPDRSL